jgi:hypothetical protein
LLHARFTECPLPFLLFFFEPQAVPKNYLPRAAIRLVLRPKTFRSNPRDLSLLKEFIIGQVPRYGDLCTPTVIITFSPGRTLPRACRGAELRSL